MKAEELKLGEMIWHVETGDLLRLKETVAYNTTGDIELDVIFSLGTDKSSKSVSVEELNSQYENLNALMVAIGPVQRAAFGLLLVDVNSIKMAMVSAFSGAQK